MTAAHHADRSGRERRLVALAGACLIAASLAAAPPPARAATNGPHTATNGPHAATNGPHTAAKASDAAAAKRDCGGVSHSFNSPAGGIAFNEVIATNVSCPTAKSVALDYLSHHGKAPSGWHARYETVVVKGNTESDVVFTNGKKTVIGADEAG